eukprot:jgi/Ulvmu1/8680/UM047_0020.1
MRCSGRATDGEGAPAAPPAAPARQWFTTGGARTGIEFTMMSYNILSDSLLYQNAYLYVGCDSRVLKWRYRFERLLAEIRHHEPAILCVQEVDKSEWSRFESILKQLGFQGFFCGRTGSKPDGCALFWRTATFRCRSQQAISMRELDLSDNAAQVVRLSFMPNACRAGVPDVVVGNIHVLFNHKRGDIKLGQARTLIDTLHTTAQGAAQESGCECFAIAAGDFNSTPHSPLYEFLTMGSLDLASCRRQDVSGHSTASSGGRSMHRGHARGGRRGRGRSGRRGGYQAQAMYERGDQTWHAADWISGYRGAQMRGWDGHGVPRIPAGRQGHVANGGGHPMRGNLRGGRTRLPPAASAAQPRHMRFDDNGDVMHDMPRSHEGDARPVSQGGAVQPWHTRFDYDGMPVQNAPRMHAEHAVRRADMDGHSGAAPNDRMHDVAAAGPVDRGMAPGLGLVPSPPKPQHSGGGRSAGGHGAEIWKQWQGRMHGGYFREAQRYAVPSHQVLAQPQHDADSGVHPRQRDTADVPRAENPSSQTMHFWHACADCGTAVVGDDSAAAQHVGGACSTLESGAADRRTRRRQLALESRSDGRQLGAAAAAARPQPAAARAAAGGAAGEGEDWGPGPVTCRGEGSLVKRLRGSGKAIAPGAWTEEELANVFGGLAVSRGPDALLVAPLALTSAYRAATGAEPPYTSSVSQGMKTVDYVLFTPDTVRCDAGAAEDPAGCVGEGCDEGGEGGGAGAWQLWPQAVLLPPPEAMAAAGMPTAQLPSDHVSLVVRFAVCAGQ